MLEGDDQPPAAPPRVYASADALALDRVAAADLGRRRARDARLLRAAEDWFGHADTAPRVVTLDERHR